MRITNTRGTIPKVNSTFRLRMRDANAEVQLSTILGLDSAKTKQTSDTSNINK